jgi:Flp pilus assembly protein TadD
METGSEIDRLREEIERALRRAFDPADVLPRLARLARLAPAASDDAIFAHRQLAELLVERHPWRAALYARRALAFRRDDDRAWAILAFCQTLLGNFRCAATAYKKAIASSPSNPWYAHNLGHLLDVALGQPKRALPFLRSAYGAKGDNSEIVASYAHALARAGQTGEARVVLERALERFDSRELGALLRWLDQGAPSRPQSAAPRRAPRERVPRDRRLARALELGLSHLPLDSKQRERALALARDAFTDPPPPPPSRARPGRRGDDVAGFAAAVAYAIVYVDHVPLSQAEVAAPFRVAVGRLRGRFAELRAKLDLIRGDARYATTRR